MTLWELFLWQKLYRDNSRNRVRIKSVKNDRKNFVLKPLGMGCGDGSIPEKRKICDMSINSNSNRVRKKRKINGGNGVVDKNDDDDDRISKLPEPIIHQIFAHLSPKDVMRTSILSKVFKSSFDSYLTFDFDQRLFRLKGGKGKHNMAKAHTLHIKRFKKYVDKSLTSRLDPVPCIDKFKLHLSNVDRVLRTCMGRWIHAAVEKNVKDVVINVKSKRYIFIFPDELLSSNSITSLKFSGFVLLGVPAMNLKNLRELSMKGTTLISESWIEKIEESCPLLEDFRIVSCRGFLHLAISRLVKLRRLEVHNCSKLSSVEIKAPNLETFWWYAKREQRCKINLKGCENLRNLTLRGRKMTDSEFNDCISKCPLLEKLGLQECSRLERLVIFSRKLKSLALIKCPQLQGVNLDAPNLYLFEYNSKRMAFPLIDVLPLCEAKIHFGPSVARPQYISGFKEFIGNFGRFKGHKVILQSKKSMVIYEDLEEVFVQNCFFTNIDVTASSTRVSRIVDNWLGEWRGTSLTLVSPSSEILKLIHTMVIDTDSNPNCCIFYSKKCWRHKLIDVQVQTFTPPHKTYHFKWRSTQM